MMTSLTSIRSVIIAIALAVAVSCTSITSPDVCLSSVECPLTSFCNRTQFSQIPLCTTRLPNDAVCTNVGLDQCKQGLTCIFDDSITSDGPLCRPRSPRGAACRLDATRPCVNSLVCERNTTTCQPFTDGFSGTPCQFDRHCQQDEGFYCQTEPGVCAPKRGPGGECNRRADNFECLGFCVSQSFSDGICVSARKEADLCTEDEQCENSFFDIFEPRADRLMCNKPRGSIGRCVRESRLIRTLGATCDPDHDRCDARRSLNCRPTRHGDHVCQHRFSRFDRQFSSHCEPQSRFSRCAWASERRECRLERTVPGRSTRFGGPSPFFACMRKSETVARGVVFMTEYAACANGTECREVPGVEP